MYSNIENQQSVAQFLFVENHTTTGIHRGLGNEDIKQESFKRECST